MLNPVIAVTRGWGHVVGAVRDYMELLPIGAAFTTTELLVLKLKRRSLDTALYRMVKRKEIERLAYGVFRKMDDKAEPLTLEEIVAAKMTARSKVFYALVDTLQEALEIDVEKATVPILVSGEPELRLVTNGPTSSFNTVVGRVVMKHVAPRKLHMELSADAAMQSPIAPSGESPIEEATRKRRSVVARRVGLALRTIWKIGKGKLTAAQINEAFRNSNFGRTEKILVRESAVWMPQWMYELLCFDESGRPILT